MSDVPRQRSNHERPPKHHLPIAHLHGGVRGHRNKGGHKRLVQLCRLRRLGRIDCIGNPLECFLADFGHLVFKRIANLIDNIGELDLDVNQVAKLDRTLTSLPPGHEGFVITVHDAPSGAAQHCLNQSPFNERIN